MDAHNRPTDNPLPDADGRLASPWLLGAVAGVLLAMLFGRSMMRTFDMDEHQFVAPAVLLTQHGYLPYRDYPYFHMPHQIYLYAAATAFFSHKLLTVRTVAVLCGWLTLLLLWRTGWKALAGQSVRTRWFLVGGILLAYIGSRLFTYTNGWAWNHDTSALCGVGSFLLLARGLKRGQIWPIALAGMLAGLAMGLRLSFALIVVPMGLSVWLGRSPLSRRGRALAFSLAIIGAWLALAPAWIPWIQVPDAFIFGNLGFAHLNVLFYAESNSAISVPRKLIYLLSKFFSDPGNGFIFVSGVFGFACACWNRRVWQSQFANEIGILLGMMPVLVLGALGPNPPQQQHVYLMMPFLTLAAMYTMALQCSSPLGLARWRRWVGWVGIAPALLAVPRMYWTVIFLPAVADWTPVRVHQVGQWIKSQCPPNGRVLTLDPIFALEAGLPTYPEYAVGRFIFHVGRYTTPQERRSYHMAWGEELQRVLEERPPVAVFRDVRFHGYLTEYGREHRFQKLETTMSYRDAFAAEEHFELWVDPASSPNRLNAATETHPDS